MKKLLFFSFILIVCGIFIGQMPEYKKIQSNTVEKLKEFHLMNRAKRLQKIATQGVSRFSKYFAYTKKSNRSLKGKWFYASDTNFLGFDSHAKCKLNDYEIIKRKQKGEFIAIKAKCKGNYKLQEKLRKQIAARIGGH